MKRKAKGEPVRCIEGDREGNSLLNRLLVVSLCATLLDRTVDLARSREPFAVIHH